MAMTGPGMIATLSVSRSTERLTARELRPQAARGQLTKIAITPLNVLSTNVQKYSALKVTGASKIRSVSSYNLH